MGEVITAVMLFYYIGASVMACIVLGCWQDARRELTMPRDIFLCIGIGYVWCIAMTVHLAGVALAWAAGRGKALWLKGVMR